MSGQGLNWKRVQQGEAQMILGGCRPILSLTFDDVRDASGDQSLSDEFCADVLNRYAKKHELDWQEGVAAFVQNEKEERNRGE